MRIGLLIDPIDPNLSYMENLRKAKSLGFDVVQLWYKDVAAQGKAAPGASPGVAPKEFAGVLGDMGLTLKSLAAYTDLVDPRRPWSEIHEFMKAAIGYAAEAGVGCVVTESGGVPGGLEDWDGLILRLRLLVERARQEGVCLLVENGPGVLVNDTALMLRMVDEVLGGGAGAKGARGGGAQPGGDWFGVNFDPANLNLVPGDVVSSVRKLGSAIKDTHAKDSVLLVEGSGGSGRKVPEEHVFAVPEGEEFIHIPRGVRWALPPVGEGDVPFAEYLGALKSVNFEGDLIIEYQGGGDREKAIVKSKRHLEKLLAGL
jgi:sugar phosphate isomerase/epimerase